MDVAPFGLVETDEIEEASESLPLLNMDVKGIDVVVSDLFFLGISGSTRPGSSVRSRLCSFAKSLYLRPT